VTARNEGLNIDGARSRVRAALAEDGVDRDATIRLLAIGDNSVDAIVVAGESVVVAGTEVAALAFHEVDPRIEWDAHVGDSGVAGPGASIACVRGPAASVLRAERVALNLLQRASGVATLASRFVAAVEGTGVTILDTRKTTPLWRDLQKYAVRCGGASNHRTDLSSMVLVKENHVRVLGGVTELFARLRARPAGAELVEVEVDSPAMLAAFVESGVRVDRLMLDNFAPSQVHDALGLLADMREQPGGGRLEIEVSGGIAIDTVRAYALDGVDFISVGALTHSAPAASISLEVRG